MAKPIVRAEGRPDPEPSPAADLADALQLIDTLADQLIRDESGQPFEPVQLEPAKEPMSLIGFLMRREPLGGSEPLLRENLRHSRERGLLQLNRALASTTCPLRPFLEDLHVEVRGRAGRIEQRAAQIERDYARTQERLQRWQDQMGQRAGGLGSELWRWLVGGQERLSLPEAIALWNRREHQALARAAWGAATELHAWALDTTADLLSRLDDLLAEARRLRGLAEQQADRQRQAAVYAPWTWQIEPRIAAAALLARAELTPLVADLLGRQAEDAADGLEGHLRAIVDAEAARLLDGLTIADFADLEAGAAEAAADDDPLILIGRALLDRAQQPTWQVTRGARPRVETLQVTPDGTPVYSLDGLASASYGDGHDRLGFVQVQLGVAKDELTLLRDGDAAFQEALQQRNLFAIEELAQAWEDQHRIGTTPSLIESTEPQETVR